MVNFKKKFCEDCGDELINRSKSARFCKPCVRSHKYGKNRSVRDKSKVTGSSPSNSPGICLRCHEPILGRGRGAKYCYGCSTKSSRW